MNFKWLLVNIKQQVNRTPNTESWESSTGSWARSKACVDIAGAEWTRKWSTLDQITAKYALEELYL